MFKFKNKMLDEKSIKRKKLKDKQKNICQNS